MSNVKVKKIVKQYMRELQKRRYPFSAVYLFGSQAKGVAHRWSDIDVAVVSDVFKKNRDKNRFLLWDARMGIDTRIEPHGFTKEEFANNADPLAYEVKKTGVRIK